MSAWRTAALTALLVAACSAAGPQALSDEELLAAFLAVTQDPGRTMSMDVRATLDRTGVGPGQGRLSLVGSLRLSGPDMAGTLFEPGDDEVGTLEIIHAGGQYFARPLDGGGSVWQVSDALPPVSDPLSGLGPGDIEYVAAEETDDGTLHRLRATDATAVLDRTLAGLSPDITRGIEVTRSTFEIDTDERGYPISATLSFAGNAPPHAPGTFSVRMEFAFADWGEPFVIAPPN